MFTITSLLNTPLQFLAAGSRVCAHYISIQPGAAGCCVFSEVQPKRHCARMQVPLEELLDDLAAMHIEEEDGEEEDAPEAAAVTGVQQQQQHAQRQQQQHGQPPGVNGVPQ